MDFHENELKQDNGSYCCQSAWVSFAIVEQHGLSYPLQSCRGKKLEFSGMDSQEDQLKQGNGSYFWLCALLVRIAQKHSSMDVWNRCGAAAIQSFILLALWLAVRLLQAIGGCTYATVFSSKKWRTLEDEPHQREKFVR